MTYVRLVGREEDLLQRLFILVLICEHVVFSLKAGMLSSGAEGAFLTGVDVIRHTLFGLRLPHLLRLSTNFIISPDYA